MKSLRHKLLLCVVFLGIFFCAHINADGAYPRYRYIVTPTHPAEDLPPEVWASFPNEIEQAFDQRQVALHFQVEEALGRSSRYWIGNFSVKEFKDFLKLPAPSIDGPGVNKLKKLIRILKKIDSDSPAAFEIVQELIRRLGSVRVQYMLRGIDHYPDNLLFSIAGLSVPVEASPFLSLRRFGVLRRRGSRIDERFGREGVERTLEEVSAPLIYDSQNHLVVGDVSTAFIPDTLPSPVQSFSEGLSMLDYDGIHPSYLISWGIGSDEAHDLSFRAYLAQILRGHRPSIDESLLSSLKAAAKKLDLSRMFFVVIENYLSEKALEVMSFIDGGTSTKDYYELPVEGRFSGLGIRSLFPGELIEVHGLAIDPEASDLRGVLNTDAMALQLYDFIHSASHENTTFILQADALPARLYRSFGFREIPESRKMLEKELIVMAATGAELKEKIGELFPQVKRIHTPELPNRVNRRHPNDQTDGSCLQMLHNFGHL